MTLIANTNDGLIPLFVVAALVALQSPARRGILIGLGAAAKFAPLALAPLFARPRGDRGRRPLVFALAMTAVIAFSVIAYAPHGDLGVVWSQTLGFQLHRHSLRKDQNAAQGQGVGWGLLGGQPAVTSQQ